MSFPLDYFLSTHHQNPQIVPPKSRGWMGKLMDLLVHLPDQILSQPFSYTHEQRGIERRLLDIGTVAKKVLEIHVFANLGDCFPAIKVEDMLDDHRTD